MLVSPNRPTRSQSPSISVTSTDIPRFDASAASQRFGALLYVGGFSYRSSDRRLSGVSSVRLTDGRSRFLAVTDTGYWFHGRIARDPAGRPTGFEDARIAPILNQAGHSSARKGDFDAEGLAVDGDEVLVAFERRPRVEAFADPRSSAGSRPVPLELPIPRRELRSNAGIEAIAVAPRGADGGKRVVVVTEHSLDEKGNLFAAILGPGGGVFKVKREEPWDATDCAFLPNGDLLLLERRFEGLGRVGMRIRRIEGSAIRPGALVGGEILIEADLGQEIDNMEGLDVSVGADGATYLALVSDDNGSFFQRNLYLEFRLIDASQTTAPAPSN